MDLAFTKEDENFRQEVKDFINKNFPQKLKDIDKRTDLTREDMLSWHKVLYKKVGLHLNGQKNMVEQVGILLRDIFGIKNVLMRVELH